MAYSYFVVERENELFKIIINIPKTLNSLSSRVLNELSIIIDEVKKDQKIKCIIITGVEKAFVAGADIEEMSEMDFNQALGFSNTGHKVFTKIERLSVPVIAALNGFTLGGGLELALSCDIRIASSKAKLGQPEVGLGIIPGFGATQRLVRTIGPGAAKHLIYTGDIIRADRALELGLVSKVVEPEVLQEETVKIARAIISKSFNAVKTAKRSINEGLDMPLENALEHEKVLFAGCFTHQDQKEGMKAFIEKRKPNFE
ncbi:MAG: hypothetical protein C0601_02360 [Candidatus Muiribacterium halophilum]|uniref:Crotonase n=1 Tax=Muiribacterium halophilum TaxID=2053465 RepID=A0A2N5ZKN9_MUIH1|nr:MAG: hypothetical protein C0601_02360 [Candidatus Muirbacterium halophilum]